MEQSVLDAINSASNSLDVASAAYKAGNLVTYHDALTTALEDLSEAMSLSSKEIIARLKHGLA
jgi:hypothetical protein